MKNWLVKAWWGNPRHSSQHSVSMEIARVIVLAESRGAAKNAALRDWANDPKLRNLWLTASPVREVAS